MSSANRRVCWSLSLLIGLLGAGACKQGEKADDSDDESETSTTVSSGGGGSSGSSENSQTVPQVGAISLEGLGTDDEAPATLWLQGEDGASDLPDCRQDGLGPLGMAFGGACHTAPMAARVMLGRHDGDFDDDGDMDCDDFTAAKDSGKGAGLLLHLLCEPVMLENDQVVSLAFSNESTHSFAVGFTDFPNDTIAAGSWTRGNSASYPADIRIWRGTTMADLAGHVALSMTDVNNGTVYMDNNQGTQPFASRVTFSNKTSTVDCAAAPSDANCHTQVVQIYAGEGEVAFGPPNGFHLKIIADDKKAPTFIALEGKYRYSAATAARMAGSSATCPQMALADMRTVYFQAVQKGSQVWGRIAFRDGDGALLSCMIGGVVDPFALMAADDGVCINRGSPGFVSCSDLNPGDYTALWAGEDDFAAVTESPVGDIWGGAPTEKGVCTVSGCMPASATQEKPRAE